MIVNSQRVAQETQVARSLTHTRSHILTHTCTPTHAGCLFCLVSRLIQLRRKKSQQLQSKTEKRKIFAPFADKQKRKQQQLQHMKSGRGRGGAGSNGYVTQSRIWKRDSNSDAQSREVKEKKKKLNQKEEEGEETEAEVAKKKERNTDDDEAKDEDDDEWNSRTRKSFTCLESTSCDSV